MYYWTDMSALQMRRLLYVVVNTTEKMCGRQSKGTSKNYKYGWHKQRSVESGRRSGQRSSFQSVGIRLRLDRCSQHAAGRWAVVRTKYQNLCAQQPIWNSETQTKLNFEHETDTRKDRPEKNIM